MEEPTGSNPYITTVTDIQQRIDGLDVAIKRHGKILDLIQPNAPGKISIRHMKLHGGGPTNPQFVIWKWTPTGRKLNRIIHYRLVKSEDVHRFVKGYGPFNGTQNDVRLLIKDIKRLMERRKMLVGILGRLAQAAGTALRHADSTLNAIRTEFETEVLDMHQRHIARLAAWNEKKAAKAATEAEKEARFAIPDPADYDWDMAVPPTVESETDSYAIPEESHLDESGQYIDP